MTIPNQLDNGPQYSEVQALYRRGLVELERCRRSPLYWAERYVWTRDDKDLANPYKPLIAGELAVDRNTLKVRPLQDDKDDYLRYLTILFELERLLLVPKSRQVRISWWAMAMLLWIIQFFPAQRVAAQSKKAGDSDKLLDRVVVMLEQQPRIASYIPWPHWHKKMNLIRIQHGGLAGISRLEGMPEGGDKIRGETYSVVFTDESAFQSDAEPAYTAIMPLIEGGARYLGVSSAKAATFFEAQINDNV